MAFYHKIHCKYIGVKGFVTLYNDALRYRYMITEKALKKAKILVGKKSFRPVSVYIAEPQRYGALLFCFGFSI